MSSASKASPAPAFSTTVAIDLPEAQALPRPQAAARADQGLPPPVPGGPQQQGLGPAARPFAVAHQAGPPHPGAVHHHQVAGPQQAGQVAEAMIG